MKKKMIVTDLTQMSQSYICIAGYLEDGTCVRPVIYPWMTRNYLKDDNKSLIRPFSIIELDFRDINNKSCPPHIEDCIVTPNYYSIQGLLTLDQQEAFLSEIDDINIDKIFGAPIHEATGWRKGWYVKVGDGKRSLGTIKNPKILGILYGSQFGKLDYRIVFKDKTDSLYRLPITDLTFRFYLDNLFFRGGLSHSEASQSVTEILQNLKVILRIGLARKWHQHPDRCYLQVTGIYSFPDYTSGRSWKEFEHSEEEIKRRRTTEMRR